MTPLVLLPPIFTFRIANEDEAATITEEMIVILSLSSSKVGVLIRSYEREPLAAAASHVRPSRVGRIVSSFAGGGYGEGARGAPHQSSAQ